MQFHCLVSSFLSLIAVHGRLEESESWLAAINKGRGQLGAMNMNKLYSQETVDDKAKEWAASCSEKIEKTSEDGKMVGFISVFNRNFSHEVLQSSFLLFYQLTKPLYEAERGECKMNLQNSRCKLFKIARIVADKGLAWIVFLGGWVGVIACRICSVYREQLTPAAIFGVGVVCLLSILIPIFLVRDKRQPFEPLYCVFMICTFSSCVDLLISLEGDGIINGWTDFYLSEGEPYLATAHGTMICYWDFFGHYSLYAAILYFICKQDSERIRNAALYWFGSIFHSLIVFLPGNVIGHSKVHLSYLLNVPYIIVPLYVFFRVTREPRTTKTVSNKSRRFIILRPLDLLLLVGLIISIVIAFIRAFAVLGSPVDVFENYRDHVEPYLKDSHGYSKLQILTYLFYFTPVYCMSAVALLRPGCHWMLDLALVHAGAAAQAQISHIGASLHWKTAMKLPESSDPFWFVNILLLVLPQLLAIRVISSPGFFVKDENKRE